jgi:hypothetical protein
MSQSPAALSWAVRTWLLVGFCSGLVALLGYMAALALRLSRHPVAAKLSALLRKIWEPGRPQPGAGPIGMIGPRVETPPSRSYRLPR